MGFLSVMGKVLIGISIMTLPMAVSSSYSYADSMPDSSE